MTDVLLPSCKAKHKSRELSKSASCSTEGGICFEAGGRALHPPNATGPLAPCASLAAVFHVNTITTSQFSWLVLLTCRQRQKPPLETLTVPKPRHQKAVLLKALDAGQVTPFLLTRDQSFFPSFGLPEDLVTVINVRYPSI